MKALIKIQTKEFAAPYNFVGSDEFWIPQFSGQQNEACSKTAYLKVQTEKFSH